MLFCHSGAVQVGWWVGDVSGLVGIEWIFLGGVRYIKHLRSAGNTNIVITIRFEEPIGEEILSETNLKRWVHFWVILTLIA